MLEAQYLQLKKLREELEAIVHRVKPTSDNVSHLEYLAELLDNYSFRLYICNEDGFQLTPNVMRIDGNWELQPRAINKIGAGVLISSKRLSKCATIKVGKSLNCIGILKQGNYKNILHCH